jgi:hypothetical protein
MRFPEPLEQRMYGNPEDILSAKQSQKAREEKRAERRTLHVKAGWSKARQAAEALFDSPAGAGAVSAVPCPTPSAMRVELAD